MRKRDKYRRYATTLRILSHWSLGAFLGALCTANAWTKWSALFLCLYIATQIIGIPVVRKSK